MRKLREQKDCLNCGKVVEERYCTHCGQENVLPRETFKHIITHFITDYLHLDEKFWSSLKPLLFKPGFLTNNYNAGKRASYVHPFRLYIFISIVFFLMNGLSNTKIKKNAENKPKQAIDSTAITNNKDNGIVDTNKLDSVKEDSSRITTKLFKESFEFSFSDNSISTNDTSLEQYRANQLALKEEERDGFIKRILIEKDLKYRNDNLVEHINANFRNNIPKMLFVLLPIFALILKLIFRRKKLYYVEHFYHSVYLHSFLFLIMIFANFLFLVTPQGFIVTNILSTVLLCALPLYVLKSFLVVYQESLLSTIFKFILILVLYAIVFILLAAINGVISFLLL